MSSPALSRVLTSGDGHFIGMVWCECPHELLDQGQFRDSCPVHGEPKSPHDPFIKEIRGEKPEVHEVRGIDVQQAVKEQHGRGL